MREDAMNKTVSFAFDAWLDQIEAQGQPGGDTPTDTAQQCGAWLLLRRAELGLTQAMIEERTGIAPWQLILLEAGKAEAAQLPEQALFRLCLVLESAQRDLAWVAAVMHLALGYASDGAERVAERVAAELAAAELATSDEASAASIPELEDEQFYVLAAHANGPLNAIGVRSAIAERWGKAVRLELPTIWAVTQDLLAHNMLIDAGEQATLPSYQLAEPFGADVLRIEEETRAVRERERQLTEARRQLEQRRREQLKQRSGPWWRKSPA